MLTALFITLALVIFHIFLHLANPYASTNYFRSPYKTNVSEDGTIDYKRRYRLRVLRGPIADLLGYYRSGFLIVQNTLVGGKRIDRDSSDEIIEEIHRMRFDPKKPYLISGDQFSVLYPRNLGVFYNQLLDPATAHSKVDWEHRQQIYLQSVLFAIDGLSVGKVPKTTLVPIAPHTITATQVHPGSVASDSAYGLLYALYALRDTTRKHGSYQIQTVDAVERILTERHDQLARIVTNYVAAVRDPETTLIRADINLASARDGVHRSSSFYDNVILWKTMSFADSLGIVSYDKSKLNTLHALIKTTFWNESTEYYQNDIHDTSFSSDWLIAYVTRFLSLDNTEDLTHTIKTISYISAHDIAEPLPIKYQLGTPKDLPWVIRKYVPMYGGEAIWSYWGAEYITLLLNVFARTRDELYKSAADTYIARYHDAIIRDGGFAETFDKHGDFLQIGPYKSIRITGWVVQFEHTLELAKRIKK